VSAAGDLPVVRMCGNPSCGGWEACDRVRAGRRTMALRLTEDPGAGEDLVLRLLRRELALSAPTDSKGTAHMVPPACEFTVHKGWAGVRAEHVEEGRECFIAVYSGPDRDLDDILAASPPWSDDLARERIAALGAAA
jgi:hypothetical protein